MQVGLLTVQLLKFGLLQVATFADQYICRPGHLPVGTNFNETIFSQSIVVDICQSGPTLFMKHVRSRKKLRHP